jgi:hypothetical protein
LDVLAPLILLTRPRAARCRIGAAAQHANDSCHQRGGDKAVQAIHHATVAGNEIARILGAEFTFDCRLQEISALGHH